HQGPPEFRRRNTLEGGPAKPPLGVWTDDSHAYGVSHKPLNSVDPQPMHDLRAVCLHRLHAEPKSLSDPLGRVTLGDELQDLALARREHLERSARGPRAPQILIKNRL